MKYFTLAELSRSDKAKELGVENIPSLEQVHNLVDLVDNVLDPLRKLWGAPIRVNSGYRSVIVNKAVGGATNSAHLYGMAVDITVGSPQKNKQLWDVLVKSYLPYTKIIDERNYSWIHITYNKQQITRKKMRGIYTNGKWSYIDA